MEKDYYSKYLSPTSPSHNFYPLGLFHVRCHVVRTVRIEPDPSIASAWKRMVSPGGECHKAALSPMTRLRSYLNDRR